MITNDNSVDIIKLFLNRLRNGVFNDNLEQAFLQLNDVVEDFPSVQTYLFCEYLPQLYRGDKYDRQHLLFISDSVLKYPVRNLAVVISDAILMYNYSNHSEHVNQLIKIVVTYRFEETVSLENDGRSIRFESHEYSSILATQNISVSYRLELLIILLSKYSRKLMRGDPPEPQEIQSVIQRFNDTIKVAKNSDSIELQRYSSLLLFHANNEIKFSQQRASQMFGSCNVLEYDELLYSNFGIPLFPLILEDKLNFEGNKIKIVNEGLGCLPPFVFLIMVGSDEFEFGVYDKHVDPEDMQDFYASEPPVLKQFLRSQKPSDYVRVSISFKKFGRSYEYHLLSESVGAWVEQLSSSSDVALPYEIPLHQLNPNDFERLCFWIVDEYQDENGKKRFRNVEWLGESGAGEQGRDVTAIEITSERKFVFQCKRVDKFPPSTFDAELEKFKKHIRTEAIIKPDVYVLFCSASITPETRNRGDKVASEMEMSIEYWPKSRIDKLVRTHRSVLERFWKIIQ